MRYTLTDNTIVETVVSNRSDTQLGGLTVDELHGHIYWSTSSYPDNSTIRRASLDGSEETTIHVLENANYVYSLAIAPENE